MQLKKLNVDLVLLFEIYKTMLILFSRLMNTNKGAAISGASPNIMLVTNMTTQKGMRRKKQRLFVMTNILLLVLLTIPEFVKNEFTKTFMEFSIIKAEAGMFTEFLILVPLKPS